VSAIAVVAPIREQLGVKSPMEVVPYLNFLVYGEPGAGKTYLAGTAQDSSDTRPILFLDVEGGVVTLRKRKDVDVIRVRSIDEVEKVHNQLFLAADKDRYYKTVIIDSVTELQKLDMRTVMKAAYDRNPDKVDPDVPSQREWGKSRERMTRIIRGFKDLPLHFIATAMLGSELDEASNTTLYHPAFPGKLRGEVPGYFDVVGYLATKQSGEEVIRTLQVAKTRRVVAKDRTDSLGTLIESPTIPTIWEKIHGS
jgi:phage nucleotide-binding protein